MNIINNLLPALKQPMRALDYRASSCICVLFIALALLWEHGSSFIAYIYFQEFDFIIATAVASIVLLRAAAKGIDKWFLIFCISIGYIDFVNFRSAANHVFLALFLLAPLAVFPHKHQTDTYSDFVRRTLGIVMIVAATQKIISGNFFNGAFLQYLARGHDANEQLLSLFCFSQTIGECTAIIWLSILSVIWQYVIGILLLINCRHILAFTAELIFVLGIGFVADEMNFQTINIAALLIAFRIPAPPIVFLGLIMLIIIDTFLISNILGAFW